MIVRIKFKASVKGHSVYDVVDMHVRKVSDAKEVFNWWLDKGYSIRGNSNVFHHQAPHGRIKFKSAKEIKNDKH
jgi:hypothetical protein